MLSRKLLLTRRWISQMPVVEAYSWNTMQFQDALVVKWEAGLAPTSYQIIAHRFCRIFYESMNVGFTPRLCCRLYVLELNWFAVAFIWEAATSHLGCCVVASSRQQVVDLTSPAQCIRLVSESTAVEEIARPVADIHAVKLEPPIIGLGILKQCQSSVSHHIKWVCTHIMRIDS